MNHFVNNFSKRFPILLISVTFNDRLLTQWCKIKNTQSDARVSTPIYNNGFEQCSLEKITGFPVTTGIALHSPCTPYSSCYIVCCCTRHWQTRHAILFPLVLYNSRG